MGHIETGARRNPTVEVLESIARALGAELVIQLRAGTPSARASTIDRLDLVARLAALLQRLPEHAVENIMLDLATLEAAYTEAEQER